MQNVSSLDAVDKKVPVPFACSGFKTIVSNVNGISEEYATPIADGGSLLTRGMVNYIGFIATLDIFLSCIGSIATFVNGITYQKYAKLEYADELGVSHELFATVSNLGNFNNNSSLISSTKWKAVDGDVMTGIYFN